MSIEQRIKDALAKHLPQALGEELQKRLNKADEDAVEVARLTAHLDQAKLRNTALDGRISKLQEDMDKHLALAAREAAVAKREHDADLAELRVKLAAAEGSQMFAQNLAMGLVRNTEYRQSVFHSESTSVPVAGGPGQYPTTMAGNRQETVSTERSAK